jgi:DNA repair photolyase
MPVIYEPRGKAREYSDLAVNLFTGCSHACRYCYCPAILRKTVESWALDPQPRKNILRELERDAKKVQGDSREILLSFMSDPYHSDQAAQLTREALLVLERYGLRVQILTKGGRRSMQDFDILARNRRKYGATIIFESEALRRRWEPGTPAIAERIEAIREAHRQGIFTWVSVEPVVDPEEAIKVVRSLRGEVDFWKIGKLNHDPKREAAIDWHRFLVDVETALDGHPCLIKKDLERSRITQQ